MAGSMEWLLLAYRMPREPSTPRIAVWRKLTRLGVAKVGDGLVALPADAKSRERLEWIADEVTEAGGEAMLWVSRLTSAAQERALAQRMAAAIASPTDDETIARDTRLRLWSEHLELPASDIPADPAQAIEELWKPISAEQLRRRDAGLGLTHRLVRLPNVSRRSGRALGPISGLLVDG